MEPALVSQESTTLPSPRPDPSSGDCGGDDLMELSPVSPPKKHGQRSVPVSPMIHRTEKARVSPYDHGPGQHYREDESVVSRKSAAATRKPGGASSLSSSIPVATFDSEEEAKRVLMSETRAVRTTWAEVTPLPLSPSHPNPKVGSPAALSSTSPQQLTHPNTDPGRPAPTSETAVRTGGSYRSIFSARRRLKSDARDRPPPILRLTDAPDPSSEFEDHSTPWNEDSLTAESFQLHGPGLGGPLDLAVVPEKRGPENMDETEEEDSTETIPYDPPDVSVSQGHPLHMTRQTQKPPTPKKIKVDAATEQGGFDFNDHF